MPVSPGLRRQLGVLAFWLAFLNCAGQVRSVTRTKYLTKLLFFLSFVCSSSSLLGAYKFVASISGCADFLGWSGGDTGYLFTISELRGCDIQQRR